MSAIAVPSSSPASSAVPAPYSASTGGSNSALYLYTFAITIGVLALIAGSLLYRAYWVRRRFRLRVEEAIRAGQPLPVDAAMALGIGGPATPLRRGKKEKKHGPMPGIWEAEMWREEKGYEVGRPDGKEWDDIMPLCLTHEAPPPPGPAPVDPSSLIPERRGPWFMRPFLTPRLPDLSAYMAQHPNPNRPVLQRSVTGISLPPIQPVWTVPADGEEVTLGVLISMPVEGKALDLWTPEEEESEVPEVCLGVMGGVMRH